MSSSCPAVGDRIRCYHGLLVEVIDVREHYTAPDEYVVADESGRELKWREHHLETQIEAGAELIRVETRTIS